MAITPNNDQSDFEAAFGEDTPTTAEPSEDDAFGITPPAASADSMGATPAALVIEVGDPEAGASAEADGGSDDGVESKGEAGEEAANATAATQARSVNEANNEKAVPAAGSTSTGVQEAGAESGAAGAPVEGSASEEAMESPAAEALEDAAGAGDAGAKPPMTEQQLRSWEGRLRVAQSAIDAKAPAGDPPGEAEGDALSQVSEQAEDTGNTALAEKADDLGEQVESGEITADDAMQQLTADFGEGFVKMIEAIARQVAGTTADSKVADVGKNVEDVISHIKDTAERAHFETIAEAHPDFVQVSESPEFQAFVKAQGAEQVVETGSAKQINALLSAFASSKAPPAAATPPAAGASTVVPTTDDAAADAADGGSDDAADAAEGVRSGGLRLPEAPATGADDFEKAWHEA